MDNYYSAVQDQVRPHADIADAHDTDATIRTLRERVTALETENAQLRHSASFFGALAERLNAKLRGRLD